MSTGKLFEFFYVIYGKGNVSNILNLSDENKVIEKLSSRFFAFIREIFNSISQKQNFLMKRHTLILEKMNVSTQVSS